MVNIGSLEKSRHANSTSMGLRFSSPSGSSHESFKQILVEHGIVTDAMQRFFLQFRLENTHPLLALSFIDLTAEAMTERRQKLAIKFDDMLNATLAMGPRTTISVLLPVQLHWRHGLSRLNNAMDIARARLQQYAWIMKLGDLNALFPLLNDEAVTVKRGDITLSFQPWSTYLTPELKMMMDALKQTLLTFFKENYAHQKPVSFLEAEGKAIQDLVKMTPLDMQKLPETTFSHIIHATLFRSLDFLARQTPALDQAHHNLCKTRGKSLATDGAIILHALYKGNIDHLAQEWVDAVMYRIEETFAMKPLFMNTLIKLMYISEGRVKEKTEPLCIEAAALLPANTLPVLETGNEYVYPEERKDLDAQVDQADQIADLPAYCVAMTVAGLSQTGNTLNSGTIRSVIRGVNDMMKTQPPQTTYSHRKSASASNVDNYSSSSSSSSSHHSDDDTRTKKRNSNNT